MNLKKHFEIGSVMCFGGEPLLYPEVVCSIISEAYECGIPRRDIITNGYFSKLDAKIAETVIALDKAKVTRVLLSVDAFHQETIPADKVYTFASLIKECGHIPIKLHPAWLVGREDDNEYNRKTQKVLQVFEDLKLPISEGNVIFPSGNAAKYLSAYYPEHKVNLDSICGQAKYTTPLDQVDTISILPNGDVCICSFVIGNAYEEDILSIIKRYQPYENEIMRILMNQGVGGLQDYGRQQGITIDASKHYSACSICRELVEKLQHTNEDIDLVAP
jgi:MoaA/NifB/PqqE/SkfB family radical SAM enzyme